jgi:hypothetical protein
MAMTRIFSFSHLTSAVPAMGLALFLLLPAARGMPAADGHTQRAPQITWITGNGGKPQLTVFDAPALGWGLLRLEIVDERAPGFPWGDTRAPSSRQLCLRFDGTGRAALPLAEASLAGLSWRVQVIAWAPGSAVGSGQTSAPFVLSPGIGAGPLEHQSGELLITEFQRNPTAVADSRGEWLELQNVTDQVIDLEGWILEDEGSDQVILSAGGAGLQILPNQCLVFGNELDRALNGNVYVQYDYGAFHLANGADEILLRRPDGCLVDVVRYDALGTWPTEAGRSASLSWAARDELKNDLGINWCPSDYVYDGTLADRGSPTRANGACP